MFKYFFVLSMLTSTSAIFAQDKSPVEGWNVVKKETNDLNGDKKQDDIFWLSKSKAKNAKPERLLIQINGKTVLDYQSKFCGPSGQNGYGNAEVCKTVQLECIPADKTITLLDNETSSLDEKRTQGHSYVLKGSEFVLTKAFYKKVKTGQMYESDIDMIDIDYKTGSVTRTLWIEYGVDKKVKEKRNEKCELKTSRKEEGLNLYNGFSVRDEIKCKG